MVALLTSKYRRKYYLKWWCLKITKDLWAYLLSLEGEDVGSIIFMVFNFRSVSMPYPELHF